MNENEVHRRNFKYDLTGMDETTGARAEAGFPFFSSYRGRGQSRVCDFSKYRGRGRAEFDLVFTGAWAIAKVRPGFIKKNLDFRFAKVKKLRIDSLKVNTDKPYKTYIQLQDLQQPKMHISWQFFSFQNV